MFEAQGAQGGGSGHPHHQGTEFPPHPGPRAWGGFQGLDWRRSWPEGSCF